MVEAEGKKNTRQNTRQRAVALRYEEDDKAPKVVAAGVGEIAKRIIELAKQNNIPIERNDTLTEILANLEVGYEIPPETYRAVAEILAFLYRTDEAWLRKLSRKKEFKLLQEENAVEEDGASLDLDGEVHSRMLEKLFGEKVK
jgi:flagellar biosynthesis protein